MIKGNRFPVFDEILNKKGKIKIACVGDSITEGWASSNPDLRSYPAVLGRLLGEKYEVKNYGIGGATLMRCSDSPYREKWGYINSTEDKPDVVLLMLGTNDGDRDYNIRRLGGFYADYVSMINEYKQIGAEVIVMTCPELFCSVHNENIRKIVEWQKEAAQRCGCELIDINEYSHTRPYCFPDHVHCDDSGYATMAMYIYNRAFGGNLYDVTVHTQPKAFVSLAGCRAPADENGVAKLRVIAGRHRAHSFLACFKSADLEIDVSGDVELTLMLAAGGRELARQKPVTFSSVEGTNYADNAVDGIENTRWASNGTDDEWICVDLGEVYTLTGVFILWETAYGKVYDILVSDDGENFTLGAHVGGGNGGADEVELPEGTRGRYVKMQGILRGTIYGYSMFDFEVFGE